MIDESLIGAAGVYVAEMNGDSILDVVATAIEADDVVWYEAPDWAIHVIGVDANLFSLHVADINNDDTLDVVVTNLVGGRVGWYEGPAWDSHWLEFDLAGASGVSVVNINGDGSLDIIAAGLVADDVVWRIDERADGPA